MNVLNKILNGLSFANVNNLGEFRARLRQVNPPSALDVGRPQHNTVSPLPDTSSAAAGIRHAEGAL